MLKECKVGSVGRDAHVVDPVRRFVYRLSDWVLETVVAIYVSNDRELAAIGRPVCRGDVLDHFARSASERGYGQRSLPRKVTQRAGLQEQRHLPLA